MIAPNKSLDRDPAEDGWQEAFLELLPKIEQSLSYALRYLRGDNRDEAIQEGIDFAPRISALCPVPQRATVAVGRCRWSKAVNCTKHTSLVPG